MNSHELYMNRCLELARSGFGKVAPNPMVGALLVHNDHIIGEGFHQEYGGAHAEVNAIHSVKKKDLLASATLYVNLEPCSHYGKTPPCTDLIIEYHIPKVVIAVEDPNPLVKGKGIQKLRQHGCEVVLGVLEKESKELNKRFITFQTLKRPYVILKWAQTLDGFIDIKRKKSDNPQPTWISGDALRVLVHKWRSEEMAILVGTKTAEMDNPQLNVRHWKGNNPLRIVLDNKLRLSKDLKLFDQTQPTLVYTSKSISKQDTIQYATIDFNANIAIQILSDLYNKGIQSMIVEGGRKMLDTFILSCLWDEARIITGNKIFEDGIKAPNCKGQLVVSDFFNKDILRIIKNKNSGSL